MPEDSKRDYNNNNDFVELFEEKLCRYTGAPYAVAVDRCTNAILLALEYFNIKSEVLILPKRTYLSVPMTLINYGYNIKLKDIEWQGFYNIENTSVFDYAVGFNRNMYVPGQIQCLSFQQKKRLSIGKGGAILLDNQKMYQTLKRMRHDGRDSSKPVSEEDTSDVIIGYHMYMSPDEASKGILLLNQLTGNFIPGSYKDYPDMTKFKVLEEYAL